MAGEAAVLGAVLVGGESRRMGADKASLRLDEESLGSRAVRALRVVAQEVVVVSRASGDHADLGAREIVDTNPGQGPLGGLEAALHEAGDRPVFLLACDLPAVSPELIEYLIGRSAPLQGDSWAVVPRSSGREQPLAAVYGPGCLAEVGRRVAAGDLRMLDLLEALATERVELGSHLPFFRPDLLDNINDTVALERWVQAR